MDQSNKHAPRIDDELARGAASYTHGAPVDARVEEHRRDEGPGPRPGQPSAAGEPHDRDPGTSEHLSVAQVLARAELATYLEPSVFPATRADLVESAKRQHAPDPVIDLVEHLPDETFDHFESAWLAADRVH
jgi:hypothetical protein